MTVTRFTHFTVMMCHELQVCCYFSCNHGTEHVSAHSSAQNAFKSAKFQSDHTLQVLTEQYWTHSNPMTLQTRFRATYS